MRTDAKVGLICGFVLVLAVVAYYAFPPSTKPAETGTGGTPTQLKTGTGDKPDSPTGGGSSVTVAPPGGGVTPTPSPDFNSSTSGSALLSGTTSLAGGPSGSGSGTVPITGPGTSTAPGHGLLTAVGPTPTTGPGSGLGGGLAGGPTGGLGGNLPGDLPGAPGGFGMSPTPSGGSSSGTPGSSMFTPPGSTGSGGLASTGGSHNDTVELSRPTPPATRPGSGRGGRRGTGLLEAAGSGVAGSGVIGLHEVAPTDTGTAIVRPSAGAASTYTVVKGDMLTAIAKKNHVTLSALKAANPAVNPDRLQINSKLKIPAAAPEAPKLPATTRPAATRPASGPRGATTRTSPTTRTAGGAGPRTLAPGSSYTIKKGDTLRKIAKAAYGDENMWRRLARSNRATLPNPNVLTAGHVLQIPAR